MFLCEKPLAVNAIEAKKMVDEAKACERQLMVCFNIASGMIHAG